MYALNVDNERQTMWEEIKGIMGSIEGPWCLGETSMLRLTKGRELAIATMSMPWTNLRLYTENGINCFANEWW